MAEKSGTTSSAPRKSWRGSVAQVTAALKIAAKQPEWQDHFSGTPPKVTTRARLREAMRKAGTLAKES